MNNKIIFGQYYDADSFLHRLDPRVKVIGVLMLFISLFFINNLGVLLGLTALLLILILCSKIPFAKYTKSISTMSSIMLFTFVMQIITYQNGDSISKLDFNLTVFNILVIIVSLVLWFLFSKRIKYFKTTCFVILLGLLFWLQTWKDFSPLITLYSINITKKGLTEASFFVIRFMDFLFLSSVLTLTTKPTQINCALDKLLKPFKKLGLNTGAFAMIIAVALKFIPTLLLEAQKILKAQASRGADFMEANLLTKAFQVVSLIIPLFIITYKKSVDLTYAMEARGYVDNKERSSLYELQYSTVDYLAIVIIVAICIFSIATCFVF